MENIRIKLFKPNEALRRTEEIVRLFVSIFAAPPWDEVFRCPRCNRIYGIEASSDTLCCGGHLSECYPVEETAEKIKEYFSKPHARIALLYEKNISQRIYGFAWGWVEPLSQICVEQLKLTDAQLDALVKKNGVSASEKVFYFDEFGIDPSLRGRGFGAELFNALFKEKPAGMRSIMRTSRKSAAYHIATTNGTLQFLVALEHEDERDRVILLSPEELRKTKPE